ncbi:hypothetical protein ACQB60_08865 [Actinomycetota bacterium Odt1-20B]
MFDDAGDLTRVLGGDCSVQLRASLALRRIDPDLDPDGTAGDPLTDLVADAFAQS